VSRTNNADIGRRFRSQPVTDKHGHRRRIAAHIREHGPQWGETILTAMGLTHDEWWAAVDHCQWFDLHRKGWCLTERGEREAFTEEVKV